MFTLTKEFRFEAAHKLPHHDGKCARLHGHSWVLEVSLHVPLLLESGPQSGMAVDFGIIKEAVAPIVEEKLDHHYLNETLPLESPTSEAIAEWVYGQVYARLLAHNGVQKFHGLEVTVRETCTSACTYKPW